VRHQEPTKSATRARSSWIGLGLIVAVGAALRFWGIRFGLPHPYARPDEEVLVEAALGVLRDPNPHFFDWPTLFIYLTAGAYQLLFAIERATGGVIRNAAVAKASFEPVLHLIPRLISATAGVLTIAVLYGAARELFSRRVALLAAALLAVTYLHVRDSHFGVTDVPMTFLTVCAWWAALRMAAGGLTGRRAAIAGVFCGLAAATKYNACLIALPAILAVAADQGRPSVAGLARAGRPLSILAFCATAAFLVGTPYAILDWHTFLNGVMRVEGHLAVGQAVGARGWGYHALFTLPYGVGLPQMMAACVGAIWMVVRERRRDAALVLLFPVAYYAVAGSGFTVFVRYMMPIVPFVCLAAAYGIDRLTDVVGQVFADDRVSRLAVVALAAVVITPTAASSLLFDRLMARVDTRVLGANWVMSHFPTGASIYQTGWGYGYLVPTPRERYIPYFFNDRTASLEVNGQKAIDLPDIIVLLESPLAVYSQVPQPVRMLAEEHYELAETLDGASDEGVGGAVYDLEDAFYAPFAGLDRVTRPGPHVRIFVRSRR
jgi:4-amino-4-deoxy-L-arabinose transferase-like glycosyltransferase